MEWKFEPDWKSLAALEQIARAEVARTPRSSGTWHSLIDLQVKLGRFEETAQSLEDASIALGPDAQGRKDFIALALSIKRPERAVVEAEALVAAYPDDDEASALLQRALIAANMMDPARRAAFAKPVELTLALEWKFAKTPADFSKLIARCRAVLADDPIQTDARWALAHALAQSGEDAAAREVMALEKFLNLSDLPLPEGYDTQDQFRTALRQEILRNPTLETDPKRRATRNGQQTRKLGLPGEPALAALVRAIKAAVARYRKGLGQRSGSLRRDGAQRGGDRLLGGDLRGRWSPDLAPAFDRLGERGLLHLGAMGDRCAAAPGVAPGRGRR